MVTMRRRIPKLSAEHEAEFWALVQRDEMTGCATWKGDSSGFSIADVRHAPSRVAYRLMAKQQPPGKLGRTCSTPGCIWPEHTRHWPPKRTEERAPDPHMREIGQAVSLILREQRIVAERIMTIERRTNELFTGFMAMVAACERMSDAFYVMRDDVAGLRAELAAREVAAAPANGNGTKVDELSATLMRAWEQSIGSIDHPNDADYDALRTAFDAAIALARKTNAEATRVFSSWLGRFARLCANNPGVEQSPRSFLVNLEALAPEALEARS